MRILALHGMGTSGPIFESQTASFRALLSPEQHTFVFPSAPFPSNPAPGIDIIYPASSGFDYHAFYLQHSAQAVRAACHWLDEYLDEHGPFDVVMGFSQGCALLSAWLLYRAKEEAGAAAGGGSNGAGAAAASATPTLPIRGAFFICGGLVLPVLEDLGITVSPAAKDVHEKTVRLLKAKAGRLVDIAASPSEAGWTPGSGLWDETGDLMHVLSEGNGHAASTSLNTTSTGGPIPDLTNVFGLDLSPSAVGSRRINIPTVHVYGRKDPRYPASIQLAHICARAKRAMFDHGGGHDIPRSMAVSRRLAELLEWLEEEIRG